MKARQYRRPHWRLFRAEAAIVLMAAATSMSVAAADDWPALRQGMWEFDRTIETPGTAGKPKTIQMKKCTRPTEDMSKQNEMLTKGGCRFSPIQKTGNAYSYSADCKMQGVAMKSSSVLTVDGDSAYILRVESQTGSEVTKEVLRARRTGDCAK